MEYNKLLRILFVFVVLMVCFNAVAAAEDMNIDAVGTEIDNLAVENDVDTVDEDNSDAALGVGNSEESLQSNEPGSFKDLQDLINGNYGSTIELDRDYVYSGDSDKSYVTIKNPITINGNNHKIILMVGNPHLQIAHLKIMMHLMECTYPVILKKLPFQIQYFQIIQETVLLCIFAEMVM